ALASEQADEQQLVALDTYARCVGLAVQVQDDLLDVGGSTEVIGKNHGADAARGKPTFPALLGLEQAHQLARSLQDQGIAALAGFDQRADRLRQLARYIVERQFWPSICRRRGRCWAKQPQRLNCALVSCRSG